MVKATSWWLRLIVLSSGLFIGHTLYGSNLANKEPRFQPRLNLIGEAGRTWDIQADYMLPLASDADSLLFTDIEADIGGFDDTRGISVGIGHRQADTTETYLLGTYLFIDRWRSPEQNYFNQLTLGAEALGAIWDYRGNLYLPFGRKEVALGESITPFHPVGHKLVQTIWSSEEEAGKGFDFEAGRVIPEHDNMRAYFGLYHYEFNDAGSTTGPRLRGEYRYDSHWTFVASEQWDRLWGNQFLLGARYNIGGVACRTANITDRMMDYIIHNNEVGVVKEKDSRDVAPSAENFFFVNSSSNSPNGGDGTFEHPYSDTETAVSQAESDVQNDTSGSTDYIYIYTGDSSNNPYQVNNLDVGSQQANINHVITGSSTDLIYNNQVVLPASGTNPVLSGGLNLNDNVEIHHITLDGTDQNQSTGLTINNAGHISIHDVDIQNYKGTDGNNGSAGTDTQGIAINNGHDVDINNVNVHDISGGKGSDGDIAEGSQHAQGSDGGNSHGIAIHNSNNINLNNITLDNLQGGQGGMGSDKLDADQNNGDTEVNRDGGNGGGAKGIVVDSSQNITAGQIKVGGIEGGDAGKGGNSASHATGHTCPAGHGGKGGDSVGVETTNSSSIIYNDVVMQTIAAGNGAEGGKGGDGIKVDQSGTQSTVGGHGGNGGAGGNAKGLSISSSNTVSFNNIQLNNVGDEHKGQGGHGGHGGLGGDGFDNKGANTGGDAGKGGDGGAIVGVDIKSSANTSVNSLNIGTLHAGSGAEGGCGGHGGRSDSGGAGNAGQAGQGGKGGDTVGINVENCSTTHLYGTVTGAILAGDAGKGGDGGNGGASSHGGNGGNAGHAGHGGEGGTAVGIALKENQATDLDNNQFNSIAAGHGADGGNAGHGGTTDKGQKNHGGESGLAGNGGAGGSAIGIRDENNTGTTLNNSSIGSISAGKGANGGNGGNHGENDQAGTPGGKGGKGGTATAIFNTTTQKNKEPIKFDATQVTSVKGGQGGDGGQGGKKNQAGEAGHGGESYDVSNAGGKIKIGTTPIVTTEISSGKDGKRPDNKDTGNNKPGDSSKDKDGDQNKGDNGKGNGGVPGQGGQNNPDSDKSKDKGDNGKGNGGVPGQGGQNNPDSDKPQDKGDNGKGNGGVPGQGGQNNPDSDKPQDKGDNGKGNGGVPGQGGQNNPDSDKSKDKSDNGKSNGGVPGQGGQNNPDSDKSKDKGDNGKGNGGVPGQGDSSQSQGTDQGKDSTQNQGGNGKTQDTDQGQGKNGAQDKDDNGIGNGGEPGQGGSNKGDSQGQGKGGKN